MNNKQSTNSLEEFLNVLREHEIKTFSKFVCIRSQKAFTEEKFTPNENTKIHWNGAVPHINIGCRVYACHQGKHKNLYQKKRYAEKRDSKACRDHDFTERRKLAQPTKKLDCPVVINVYRVLALPRFKEGTDIEGTLFLYRRSLYPFHGFIIVNRMSTTNFVEVITSDMEFLLQEPYFLYKKSCGEIIGSWFYEEKDFRRITNKIQSIVLKQNTAPKRQRSSSDSYSQLKKDDAVQDIMSMLFEAHTEYVKSEIDETAPQENSLENFNDMTTYADKNIINKAVNTLDGKSKHLSTRSSSEEKYPVSPRRRFLSTGSIDSTRPLPQTSNKVLNELVNQSKGSLQSNFQNMPQAKNGSQSSNGVKLLPFKFTNIESSSGPTRLSPLFSHDEIISPTLSGFSILDNSTKSSKVLLKSCVTNMSFKTNDLMPNLENRTNNQKDYNVHSSNLKDTLISHLEKDSDIVLKIHEAYVASLKSAFKPKKS